MAYKSEMNMKVPIEEALASPSELQDFEYSEGQIVEHKEEGAGVIAAIITSNTEWYPDPSDDDSKVKVEASEEDPVYIVALVDGGSVPAEPSDLESGPDELPGDGAEPDLDEADETEQAMAPVYSYMDDPYDYAELQEAKKRVIHEEYAEELAEHMDSAELSLYDMGRLDLEELLNIPGVDDPEVGFASDPEGWTRKSYLQAWATVGATWRSCYARMLRHFGSRMSKRWCAALKDEVLGTERWRNRF
ncbi:hypothetical protein M199_gp008 [Halogranum tailed virus 1]|uniref:Uncharacterized protein n=1 Tax=Halogranum tailed virus 1 TaxID=1273749 RepID=R4TMD9_9CAUD|nr:hypothetical protein M199_gp008 [Halogranum tailed virus 1]AGM11338.1 hypothetical protein HGTV1_8 [Halogranum tailed virus 1]